MKKAEQFILAICGVAASGKKSVTEILRQDPKNFRFSISYTTRRPIRPGEVNGVDYNFVSEQEFDEAAQAGEFLEWENVHGFRYGTKKKDFEDLLASGCVPVIEIDVKGIENLRKNFQNVVSVMIVPPSLEEAERRLRTRGTESEEDIAIRISRYQMEMSHRDKHDYVIVNDNLENAQQELLAIIRKEIAQIKTSQYSTLL